MAELLPTPEVAAGATEVFVVEWLTKAGDTFSAGDLIVVLETEKAVVEVPAERNGTLLRPLVEAGSQAEVGAPMALIGSAQEVDSDIDALLRELGVGEATGTPGEASSDGAGEAPQAAEEAFESDDSVPLPRASSEGGGDLPLPPAPADGSRIFASPIARKLLREAGLQPQDVSGSGPQGRIRRRDVDAAIASRSTRPSAVAETGTPAVTTQPANTSATKPAWTEIPHSRVRRMVATRLTQSKQQIPHYYLRRAVELDSLQSLRASVNENSPVRVSVNDLIIKAIGLAHTAVPEANVIWTDEVMRQFETVDVAVAIASEKGLVTPVLRDVQSTSVSGIASRVRTFVNAANAGRLQQQDLEGGSITISNLGRYGVDEFSAIINPPHSAILAVGAAKPTVVARDGQPVVATTAHLVLSVDHRAIDGALAAQWMSALVDAMERPLRLLV